jgi:hypothetical protein
MLIFTVCLKKIAMNSDTLFSYSVDLLDDPARFLNIARLLRKRAVYLL